MLKREKEESPYSDKIRSFLKYDIVENFLFKIVTPINLKWSVGLR